ncbi:30S ribosomal protein S18 [Candidatus Daviesbacteria bacterium]|nr:30S ribosomal protein S18 [Candidatus Daviesbacteria bacterium]
MAVTRQVKSKINQGDIAKEASVKPEASSHADKEESGRRIGATSKKVCTFCKGKTEPKYTDALALRRFINDRGRISNRSRSGLCAKHQRRVAREIKRARHLALLPFTVKI